jgi:HlyD family secretion protein
MNTFLKILVVLVIVGGCLGAAGEWYLKRSAASAVNYRTVPVTRGDLLATISATGTLEPEEVVDVGAQVQGRIVSLGVDPGNSGHKIDYNTEVNEGDILAQIDPVLYAADVSQAQASNASAEANVSKAEADLKQAQAKAEQAKRDWDRAQKSEKNVMSQAEKDAAEAAFDAGNANVVSAQAGIALAKAGVASAAVSLKRAQDNLSYCTIKSPVKGVIIDRRVNVGQTVVSSLNAPSLFLIAKDLTRMQIWAAVNEADIGHIEPDQAVTFRVDKLPGREFRGVVGKVRMNAQTTQNVVTYTVEINVDNSDRALIPYLTTNVQFQQGKRDGVLMVPNTALRWAPSQPAQISPGARAAAAPAGGGGRSGPTTKRADGAPRQHGTVWMVDGTFAKPIKVKLGITDGANTEVSADELKEGVQVIVGEARPEDTASGDAKNPFMPQFGRKRGG